MKSTRKNFKQVPVLDLPDDPWWKRLFMLLVSLVVLTGFAIAQFFKKLFGFFFGKI